MTGLLQEAERRMESTYVLGETKNAHLKENHVVREQKETSCVETRVEKLQTMDLASAQELTARMINPMKLIMLLRLRFGIGHYEISVRLSLG